jgi:hypothetical protein
LLNNIVWRAAVSTVAGLLVAAFAAAALALGTIAAADRLSIGRTLSGSLGPVLSAIVNAGFLAGIAVFACLVANDVVRGVGPWLIAQRRRLLGPFRAITWSLAQIALAVVVAIQFVARSTVFLEFVSLLRTVGIAVGLALYYAMLAGGFVGLNIGLIALGLYGIGECTRILVAILDDPPRLLPMAFDVGGVFALMYVSIGAFVLCGWLAYRVAGAGLRTAARRLGPLAS